MQACRSTRPPGFTLIELLIVISVILILIALALPNFLASRTRAKIARVESELRSISQSLDRYLLDFGFFPLRTSFAGGVFPSGLNNLTTPIEYMKPARLRDPFTDGEFFTHYRYWPIRPSGFVQANAPVAENKDSNWYLISSNGPDTRFDAFAQAMRGEAGLQFRDSVYSPTNGVYSGGNIWRLGGSADGVAAVNVIPALPPGSRN